VYKLFRALLFALPAETAHYVALDVLKFVQFFPGVKSIYRKIYSPKVATENVFGLTFNNQLGLAAGFDKNAKYLENLETLGFGHIEIGTVTPKPQIGNPKPRLFRLIKDKAIINRMGFNNDGMEVIAQRLAKFRKRNPNTSLIVGVNIGKNKVTPNESAVEDYKLCFNNLHTYADYFTVNVSSPNTPGLRELQEKEPLTKLLNTVQGLNNQLTKRKPILLKIAPDLTESQLDDIVEIVTNTKIDGLITTNTTIERGGLKTDASTIEKIGNGGLSGAPEFKISTDVLIYLRKKLPATFPIIGVGGIMDKASAQKKLEAGAALIQVYSGFVYNGPSMAKQIL